MKISVILVTKIIFKKTEKTFGEFKKLIYLCAKLKQNAGATKINVNVEQGRAKVED